VRWGILYEAWEYLIARSDSTDIYKIKLIIALLIKDAHPKNNEKDKIKESETLKPPEKLEEGTNDKINKKQSKKQKKNKNKEKKIDSSKG